MWLRSAIAGVAAFGLVFAASTALAAVASADDSSALTVTARDKGQDPDWATSPMPNLRVTVSQTRNLLAQAITIDWSGAPGGSTRPSGQTGGENYLQIMQCWGNVKMADGTLGPDRTTCQFGGFLTPGATRDGNRGSVSEVAGADRLYTYVGQGGLDVPYTGIPFKAAVIDPDTGANTMIEKIDAEGKKIPGADLNTNQFFTKYTTNEIPWAGSAADGTGSITFETQTALQAPGLGCGTAQTGTGGAITGQPCWLVVVPRGAGTNIESPLFADVWKHRLAVRLDFQPVGEHCAIGAVERQLAGSELASDAVSSWQPSLCGAQGGSAYTLLTTTDSDAAAAANTMPDAPLALTSGALDTSSGATDNLTYAPIALTGVAVTFAIDQFPSSSAPAQAQERARQPMTSMNLTPRLLAKLLTSSYTGSLPANAPYLAGNPRNVLFDPDFLEINDAAWRDQAIVSASVSDLMVTQGRSGYAEAIWKYILADADARAFLAGTPDKWGMKVNPYAATDAAVNPNGSPLDLPRADFPKVDPTELYSGEPQALNSVTWRPFISDLASGAYLTLRGDGLTLGDWDPNAQPPRYTKNPRRLVGERSVLALTDTAAAERYSTVTAALRNPAGAFVAPTTDALSAAAAAMTPVAAQPQVLSFDSSSEQARAARSAYPLAIPVYAATNAGVNSADVRKSYAQFVRYAVSDGQTPGLQQGQLPPGYAPLPQGWRIQALNASEQIASGGVAPSAPAVSGASTTAPRSAAAAAAAPAAVAPATPANPTAKGAAAGALSSGSTPADPDLGPLSSALPLSVLAGVAAAGAVPFVGRLRRP